MLPHLEEAHVHHSALFTDMHYVESNSLSLIKTYSLQHIGMHYPQYNNIIMMSLPPLGWHRIIGSWMILHTSPITQVSYGRFVVTKGVWCFSQVCDYIVTPNTNIIITL